MSNSITTSQSDGSSGAAAVANTVRIGVVSYLNALPLIDGVDQLVDIALRPDVPSRLIDDLLSGEVDIALCSIFDYQSSPEPLVIVPAGLLGCNGSTMTVRLFSRVPINRVSSICCDTDSHTSVNLLRVLLHEVHQIRPTLIPFDARTHSIEADGGSKKIDWPESMLLIGDKVVTEPTPAIRYPYQMDLGAEWKELTGLPFVFAAWMARADHAHARDSRMRAVAAALDRQRRHNRERIDQLIAQHAEQSGWPGDLARTYLHELICYEWNEEARAGVEQFFKYLHDLGLIEKRRSLTLLDY